MFLPKNTTSWLQPLDVDIIRNFKHKYKELLLRFLLSRIDDNQTASPIADDVYVLKAITWLQTAWKSITPETIKGFFKKCGFDAENNSDANEINTEFWKLFE